ncbi:hypothetical protein C9F09_01160, partial [Salmonella enterica subsp. enterica serovar Wilhelmsburg]
RRTRSTGRQPARPRSTQVTDRTLLSHDKSAMLQQPAPAEPNVLPEQAIRDPFILEFLNLKDEYTESDLEAALLSHLC